MDHDNNQEEMTDERLKEFWGQFRLFPSNLGNYIYSHVFPVFGLAVLPYFLYLITGIVADIIKDRDWYWTNMALSEWQEITAVIGLILISMTYLRWQAQVPEFFQWLYKTGRLVSTGSNLATEYLTFLQDYQSQLHKGVKRYSFAILLIVLTILANLVVGIPQDIYRLIQTGTYHEIVRAIILFIIWIFGFLLWTWFVGLAAWPAFVTGRQIFKLREKFGINVQASHPDRCGGLEPIGSFCFSMTLPIVVGGLIIVLFIIAGTVFRDVSIGNIYFSSIMHETVLFMNVILFLVFLPLVVIVFLMPLWSIHAEMLAQKRKHQDEYSNQIIELEKELRSYVRQEKGLERAKLAREKIEVMQAINPQKTGFPVWPFRANLVISLVSPQIFGIVGTFVSVIEIFKQ